MASRNAIVGARDYDGNGKLFYWVCLFNPGNPGIVTDQQFIYIDQTPNPVTPASCRADLAAKIASWATGLGHTLANVLYPEEPSTSGLSAAVSVPTFSDATTAQRLSTTKIAHVKYAFDASVTISLLAGSSIRAILEYADDAGMSVNVVRVESNQIQNSGVLGLTQGDTLSVAGWIPANKYRKVRFTTTGGATAPTALDSAQEVLL